MIAIVGSILGFILFLAATRPVDEADFEQYLRDTNQTRESFERINKSLP